MTKNAEKIKRKVARKKATKKPRAIGAILKDREKLHKELGFAISSELALAALNHTNRPPIAVQSGSQVAVRMVKNGVVYGFALNKLQLPFQENGFYPLSLVPGTNGLVWLARPAKKPWAFQVQLLVDGTVVAIDQHSSAETSAPTTTIIEQQPIVVS